MRRPQYFKSKGYPTDHLLDRLSDEQLLDHMGVPSRYWGMVMDTPRPLPARVQSWADSMRFVFRPTPEVQRQDDLHQAGVGMILYGPSGTGKTTMAAGLLLRLVRQRIPNIDPSGRNWTWAGAAMGRFYDWQAVSEAFRLGNSGDDTHAARAEAIRSAMRLTAPMTERADLLVVDDISRERATEYNLGELQRILRHRFDNCFPTIITTNFPPDGWAQAYGDVMSAFMSRAFVAVEVPR